MIKIKDLMFFIKNILTKIKSCTMMLLTVRKDNTMIMEVHPMKKLNQVVKVIAKILEIAHWVGAGLMVAVAVCSAAAPQWVGRFMDVEALGQETEVTVYGFEVAVVDAAGQFNTTVLCLFAIGAVLIFALVAMMFRNINLILKKAESATPFHKDNVRMVREIGIFSIAIPVIGVIMSTIIRLVVGVDATEASVRLGGVIMGVVVLCLSQVFAYGGALERDVDGLV